MRQAGALKITVQKKTYISPVLETVYFNLSLTKWCVDYESPKNAHQEECPSGPIPIRTMPIRNFAHQQFLSGGILQISDGQGS